MTNHISTLPYELIRKITSHLPLTDALRLGECCVRLASFRDYNHDPRLDDQAAIIKASKLGLYEFVGKLLHVRHVNLLRGFEEACLNGHVELVKLFTSDSHSFSHRNLFYGFQKALGRGHLGIVQEMVESGKVDPSAHENSAIMIAAKSGYTSIVEFLLRDSRVDARTGRLGALWHAAIERQVGVLEILVNDNQTVNAGNIADIFTFSAQCNYCCLITILLNDDRLHPDAMEFALLAAIHKGKTSALKLLLNDWRFDPRTLTHDPVPMAAFR
jgi:Ankyrin repeats (3 copies)